MDDKLKLVVEFSGGAELLFGKVKKHELVLPRSDESWNIRKLMAWIRDNLLEERPELFMLGETVRPGILVLVNDVDWELMVAWKQYQNQLKHMGELDYVLQDNDTIVFISTLHGG